MDNNAKYMNEWSDEKLRDQVKKHFLLVGDNHIQGLTPEELEEIYKDIKEPLLLSDFTFVFEAPIEHRCLDDKILNNMEHSINRIMDNNEETD